jgi:1-aminocyclopropane-1-carboxylate deaminase
MVFNNDDSRVDFLYTKNGVSVYMKREDLLHEHISGNKFRKLKYNILEAQKQNKEILITFGGAYSNHITATAYAGKLFGFKTIGIIRGDELANDLQHTLDTNPSLNFAYKQGMRFKFVTRTQYREKKTATFLSQLKNDYKNCYIVPEGGTNDLAIKGCEEILRPKDEKFDYICSAVGTGGTISGIINVSKSHQQVIGFPALKGDFLQNDINQLIRDNSNWELNLDYHFGGFAKINNDLVSFMNTFKTTYKVALDPIYTAKMMYGLDDLISKNRFKEGTKILAIHTGGLQGVKAMNIRLSKKRTQQIV